jgi:integrase
LTEIAGLRWANVDLNAKTVTVTENRVAVGKEIVTSTPKSKASTRTLPMPDEVVEVLRAARKRQAEERLAFGAGYGVGRVRGERRDRAALPPEPAHVPVGPDARGLDIGRVRLHDARHSCATLMPSPGADSGDRGVAGTRQRGVHAVGVRAQPGRRAQGGGEQFRSSCDNS